MAFQNLSFSEYRKFGVLVCKMKKSFFKIFLFSFFFSVSFLSCSFGVHEIFTRMPDLDSRSGSIKFLSKEETELQDDILLASQDSASSNFSFVVFADIHYGKKNYPNREDDFINWLSSKKENGKNFPSFIVCLGDIAEHGYSSEYDSYVNFTNRVQKEFGIKTYTILGNHDLYNSGYNNFKSKVFPYCSSYNFKTESFSFYFIDTASCAVGKNQFESLQNAFEKDNKKKIIFSHFPLTTEGDFYFRFQDITERNRFIALLADKSIAMFFSGHTHKEITTDFGAFKDINIPSFSKSKYWLFVNVEQKEKNVSYEVVK